MDTIFAIIAGGFLLGLAGSLHCACMCGGIASGALFLVATPGSKDSLVPLFVLQAGRVTTYALAGAAVAGLTSLAVDPGTTAVSYRVLQWLAAVMLMWMGLSMAGMLPRLAVPGSVSTFAASLFSPLSARLRGNPVLSSYALGLTWGLTPCPMVYAALMSAPLVGTAGKGALWMAGFGAGTLPGVLGAALGVSGLMRLRKGPVAETIAGLAVAAIGFGTLYFGVPMAKLFCITR